MLKRVTVIVVLLLETSSCLSNITANQYALLPELFTFDDYQKCLFGHTFDSPVYCRVSIQLLPEDPANTSPVWNIIEELSSNKRNYRHDMLRHGVCLSRICPVTKNVSNCLELHYKDRYRNLGLVSLVTRRDCETQDPNYTYTTFDVLLITLSGAYLLFVLGVSIWSEILKVVSNCKGGPTRGKFLSAFSIRENLSYILNTTSKPTQDYMFYIQGLRFVLSVVIIVLHSVILLALPVENPSRVEEETRMFSTIFLARVLSIVQGFFVISAWLLAISFYDTLKKRDELGFGFVVRTIVRRYIRLTPGKAILMVSHSTYLVHLFRGPFWQTLMDPDYQTCRKKWWQHLSYSSNLHVDDIMCVPHTWYLTADFHLTVLGVVILWLTQKKPRFFIILLGLVVSFQVIFMFFYLSANNFEFGVLNTPETLYNFTFLTMEELQATWTSTSSNLSGLVSGLFFGYLHATCHKNEFFTLKFKILWATLTPVLIFGVILTSSCYMTTEYYSNSRWFAATYGAINKPLFVFGIGLLIFGLSQGRGGIMKKFLELPCMHTLGQLSFGAYLIHFTIAKILFGFKTELVQVTKGLIAYEAIKTLGLSYLGSLFFSVFVLLPVDRLSKSFLK